MKTIFLFCFILLTALYLFRESFSIGFFQDDYFVLKISDVDSLSDIFSFFIPRNDVQFYRPLSVELWYFMGKKLFVLQPLVWHIAGWMLWATMIILIYKIGKKFLHQRALQFLLPVLYGLSSIHYSTLFWNINTSYLLVSVFFFAVLLVWWSENNSWKKIFYVSILFTLGLLSNELIMTLLPILIIDGLLLRKASITLLGYQLFPMVSIAGLYVLTRIMYPPDIGSYPVELSAIPSSYRWFIFFFLNWPESIKDNMLTFWKIRPEFFRYFTVQVIIWSLTGGFILMNVFLSMMRIKQRIIQYHKLMLSLLFVVCWFFVSVLPIVVVPSHITPHHGSIGLAGFLLLLLIPVDAAWKKISPVWRYASLYIIIVLWLLSARTTVIFNNETYWIKRRSDIVKTWQAWTKNTYPNPPIGSEIVIPSDEKEVRVALNEGEAIRQIYDDETLRIIFTAAP